MAVAFENGIGKHCTICNLNDFLPFDCNGCGKTFCQTHKEHQCVQQEATCPKCGITITAKGDITSMIESHIANSCPKTIVKKKKKKCWSRGCRRIKADGSGDYALQCKCGLYLCTAHREHECAARVESKEVNPEPAKDHSHYYERVQISSMKVLNINDYEIDENSEGRQNALKFFERMKQAENAETEEERQRLLNRPLFESDKKN